MRDFTPSSKANPCPVCNDTEGDCRHTIKDTWVLCKSYPIGDSPNNQWKWASTSSNPLWGNHNRRDDKPFDRELWNKGKEERDRVKRDRQIEELAHQKSISLSVELRDHYIRKIAAEIGLNPEHKADLLRRGLNDAQIEASLAFSIEPNTKIQTTLPANMPGVSDQKFSVTGSDRGYGCVAFNEQGQALSWQLRQDKTEKNKYKWALNSKLKNNEYPITVINPGLTRKAWLMEGFLKPFVAANKHQITALGSPNGQFSGSPLNSTTALKDIQAIIIVPDAGDKSNKNVMMRWSKQILFLYQIGKRVEIAYWRQDSKKEHQDIDELDNLDAIEFITPKEFFKGSDVKWDIKDDAISALRNTGFHRSDVVKLDSDRSIKPGDQVRVTFEANQRQDAVLKAFKLGFKFTVDSSFCGSGKTHSLVDLEPEMFGEDIERILYVVSSDARNPAVSKIRENFPWLRSRHTCLKRTEDGKLVPAKPGEYIAKHSNCKFTEEFNEAYANNIDTETANTVICGQCPWVDKCQSSEGYEWGFKYQRQQDLKKPQLRAHIKSLPNAEEFDYTKTVIIVEEISSVPVNELAVIEINKLVGALRRFQYRFPEFKQLNDSMVNLVNEDAGKGKELLDGQLTLPDEELIEKIDNYISERIKENGVNLNKFVELIFLKNLLAILLKKAQGSILRTNKELTISTLDRHYLDIVNNSMFVLGLDATPKWTILDSHLFPDALEIREVMPPMSNLTVVDIQTSGVKSVGNLKDETMLASDRLKALMDTIKHHYPTAPVIGFKQLNDKYYWFNHNRGCNDFDGCSELISYGVPNPNVGAKQLEYRTIFGHLDGFWEFYNLDKLAEIIQEFGRLRAQNKPDREFKLFCINDGLPLDALAHLVGAKYAFREAWQVNSLAGTPEQVKTLKTIEAIIKLVEQGQKLTQEAIAKELGINQSNVSRLPGYKGYAKKLYQTLLQIPKNDLKPLSDSVCGTFYAISLYITLGKTHKMIPELITAWLRGHFQNLNSGFESLPTYFDLGVKTTFELRAQLEHQFNRVSASGYPWLVETFEVILKSTEKMQPDGGLYRAEIINAIKQFPKFVKGYGDSCRERTEYFYSTNDTITVSLEVQEMLDNQLAIASDTIIKELETVATPVLDEVNTIISTEIERQNEQTTERNSTIPAIQSCIENSDQARCCDNERQSAQTELEAFVQKKLEGNNFDLQTTKLFILFYQDTGNSQPIEEMLENEMFLASSVRQFRNTPDAELEKLTIGKAIAK